MDRINAAMRDAEKNLEGLEKCCGLCVLPWNRYRRPLSNVTAVHTVVHRSERRMWRRVRPTVKRSRATRTAKSTHQARDRSSAAAWDPAPVTFNGMHTIRCVTGDMFRACHFFEALTTMHAKTKWKRIFNR